MPETFELFCDGCGALYVVVHVRGVERPLVHCSYCGGVADVELPTGDPWHTGEAYDEDGPDVQITVASAPRFAFVSVRGR